MELKYKTQWGVLTSEEIEKRVMGILKSLNPEKDFSGKFGWLSYRASMTFLYNAFLPALPPDVNLGELDGCKRGFRNGLVIGEITPQSEAYLQPRPNHESPPPVTYYGEGIKNEGSTWYYLCYGMHMGRNFTEWVKFTPKINEWVKVDNAGWGIYVMLRPNGTIYRRHFERHPYEWVRRVLTPRTEKRWSRLSRNGYIVDGAFAREIEYNIPRRLFVKGAERIALNRPELRVSTGRMDGFHTDTHLYFYQRRGNLRVAYE